MNATTHHLLAPPPLSFPTWPKWFRAELAPACSTFPHVGPHLIGPSIAPMRAGPHRMGPMIVPAWVVPAFKTFSHVGPFLSNLGRARAQGFPARWLLLSAPQDLQQRTAHIAPRS
eukprot:2572456-Pyramimonas_sp.AAC.1